MERHELLMLLQASGLHAEEGRDGSLRAFADPLLAMSSEPEYRFDVSLTPSENSWSLGWSSSPVAADGRQLFDDLESAVEEVLKLFGRHRAYYSPETYGDQFARFRAADPLAAIEEALIRKGWLDPQEDLKAVGLYFVRGATFSIHMQPEARIVKVDVEPDADDRCRLRVTCHKRSAGGPPWHSYRIISRNGAPMADELAPELSYRVAMAVHEALANFAEDLRWATNHDPDHGPSASAPYQP